LAGCGVAEVEELAREAEAEELAAEAEAEGLRGAKADAKGWLRRRARLRLRGGRR
jgi:hypothetical protein